MPFFEGRRGLIHHQSWSSVSEPQVLVVLLHGLGEHLGLHERLVQRISAAGAEVHALDHAGHGHSEGERVLIEDVDDLVADAETLTREAAARRPGLPVVIAGHSLGATVATLLTARLLAGRGEGDAGAHEGEAQREGPPVAGLVIAGSDLLGEGPIKHLPDLDIDPMTLRKDPTELCRDSGHVHRIRTDPLVWQGGIRPETIQALIGASARTAALVDGGALTLPVLLVHGEDDDLAPADGARRVAERLPQATLTLVPNALHNVLNEVGQDAVHATVADFVREVAAQSLPAAQSPVAAENSAPPLVVPAARRPLLEDAG